MNQPINVKFFLRMITILGMNNGKTSISRTINDANDRLSGDLLNAIAQDRRGHSLVLSGFSVLQPLAQLCLAAEGPSQDELLKAIGLPDNRAVEDTFETRRIDDIPQTKGIELKTASKLYVHSRVKLNPQFEALSKKVFESEIQQISFEDKNKAAKEMNRWVESKTNGLIKDLVNPENLNPLTVLVMLNAIYFKGKWKVPFKRELTLIRDFHVSDTTSIEMSTMFRSGKMKFGNSIPLSAKLLELPYEGDGASFLVILPNTIDGLLPLIKKLKDPATFTEATDTMRYENEVHVHLPKFTIETTTDLALYLQKVGVKRIFSAATAGLTKLLVGMDREKVYVSDAIQKAYIEVNEEGTEAAAANDIGIAVMSMQYPITFNADHPFVYYVRFNKTTIFSGVFAGPEEAFRDLTRLNLPLD